MRIEGTAALVTGGARRIGRVLCLALADAGAKVAVHYNTSERDAWDVVEMIRARGGNAVAIRADLSNSDECEGLWSQSIVKLNAVPRILVNNASYYERATAEDTTHDSWDRTMAVNVRAPFILSKLMAKSLAPSMPGKIVMVNDRRQAYRTRFAYGVSVAALSGLTRSLAVSLGPNVQVNELLLGPVLPPREGRARGGVVSSNRKVLIDEVAEAMLAIIRDDDATGTSVEVRG